MEVNIVKQLVSIIVPIYNVERYLRKCLESIKAQTYMNIEVIMVNDGSTDNSPLIAKEYEDKDGRFRLVHKKNGGLSSARNFGLEYVTGEFVAFVDSDDFLADAYVEKLLNAFDDNTDVVIGDYVIYSQKDQKAYYHNEMLQASSFSTFEEKRRLVSWLVKPGSTVMSVWKNLYRMSFLNNNNIRYISERIVYSEDILFNIEAYSKARKVTIIPEIVFYHLVVEGSLSQGYRKNMFDMQKELSTRSLKYIGEFYGMSENLNAYSNPSNVISGAMLALCKCPFLEAMINIKRVLKDEYTVKAYQNKELKPTLQRRRIIYSVGKCGSPVLVVICVKAMLLLQPLYRLRQKKEEFIL